ncbi:hypothetical protein NGM99_17210 [Mesorhizobium sp. RP14(2022)]|uniref:Mobilization protein n=1 Tax=Mesorhizobium liriopis TaxID=2953882 RepID=A0ABT1CBG1_9HYPH|nr:hypothetical protein [Mesorhizobium liriopis]MCO6051526.1 hypothetical protein [Mesorhizobium liriopis]
MSLTGSFNPQTPEISKPPITSKASKRLPPFSIRLTEADRARLAMEAAGAPLGSYIKSKLLADASISRRRKSGQSVEDKQALAKALALLGGSQLFASLSELLELARNGALPFSPEIEAELLKALAEVRELRRLLMRALGLKPEVRE